MKTGIQNEEDRLSDLPDSVILHILSFLKTEEALQTYVLSKRWKNIPRHLPTLIFKPSHFNYGHSFGKFVSQILSLRDHSTPLDTLDWMEFDQDFVEPDILKSILEYAVSHNIQLLRFSITCEIKQFPSCFFSSKTLTSLDLNVHTSIAFSGRASFPNSLNLPALTTLALRSFYFCAGDDGCAEPFSAFNKLDTLLIEDCQLLDAQILCISSTTLINLTVNYEIGYNYLDSYKCKLSTPSLCNLNYTGVLIHNLCRSDLCSLKDVCIDVFNPYCSPYKEYYPFVLNLLLELANIKSLTVSSTTLQVLFFVPDLFKVKLASLYNLESLQVKVKLLEPPVYYE
ncbi:F-box/LRR-repeat protein, partial [Trifolium pratense]